MRPNDYKIVEADDPEDFRNEVLTAVNGGWELWGGVATCVKECLDPRDRHLPPQQVIVYTQAMIR
jgi:hypothetical protein